MEESRLGWLGLSWFDGFGARTLRKLWKRFDGDGARAYRLNRADLTAAQVGDKLARRFLEWRTRVDPPMLARRLAAEHIRFVVPGDSEFPGLLGASSDPPAVLFVRGAPLELKQPIAIVGTRAMTPYGARVTRDLGQTLARAGCEIISGLALGIDAEAHQAALVVGGVTVAVLAGGCNDEAIYPRHNLKLAQRILEHGGTIVSEFPPGMESYKHLFPLRNRLIAALSRATIVVEAAEASGSLITATLALEENRDVFAVPGPITSEQSSGTNRLLTLGAIPCLSAHDILTRIGLARQNDPGASIADLPPLEQTDLVLLAALSYPREADELLRSLSIAPQDGIARLGALELSGLVEHDGGTLFSRTVRGKYLIQRQPQSAAHD